MFWHSHCLNYASHALCERRIAKEHDATTESNAPGPSTNRLRSRVPRKISVAVFALPGQMTWRKQGGVSESRFITYGHGKICYKYRKWGTIQSLYRGWDMSCPISNGKIKTWISRCFPLNSMVYWTFMKLDIREP
jgi:hypothetical protein